MYTISVKTRFTASHQLTLADGSKEPLHCHNWSVTADVSSGRLNSMGLVMDFRRLKAMVDNIVAVFDNAQLETLDYFRRKASSVSSPQDCGQRNSSSAENVAKYIYEKLEPKLPKDLHLDSITVVEGSPKRKKGAFGDHNELNCSAKFTGK